MTEDAVVGRRAFVAALTAVGAGVIAAGATPEAVAATTTGPAGVAVPAHDPRGGSAQIRLFLRVNAGSGGAPSGFITGDSGVNGYVGWIPCASYQFGLAEPDTGGRLEQNPALSVTTPIGRHSLRLLQAFTTNKTLTSVQLAAVYSTVTQWRMLDLTFSTVRITDFVQGGPAGAALPQETWTFGYGSVSGSLRADDGSGKATTPITFEWNPSSPV